MLDSGETYPMLYLILKALITGVIVVAISEISKRSSLVAAVLASLPLTSILAMLWMYRESKDIEAIKSLSMGIFWMVLPSLFFFLALPILLKNGFRFYSAMVISCGLMAATYWGYSQVLKHFGVVL